MLRAWWYSCEQARGVNKVCPLAYAACTDLRSTHTTNKHADNTQHRRTDTHTHRHAHSTRSVLSRLRPVNRIRCEELPEYRPSKYAFTSRLFFTNLSSFMPPPPNCIAHAIAIPLHDCCAIFLLCHTPYDMGHGNIVIRPRPGSLG